MIEDNTKIFKKYLKLKAIPENKKFFKDSVKDISKCDSKF